MNLQEAIDIHMAMVKPKSGRTGKRGKQPHGALVNQCIRWLYLNGCFVWENKSGAWKTDSGRPIRYGKVGSTDIIGMTRTGKFIGVEVKVGKDTLKPQQEMFRDRMLAHGAIYVEARSLDDLEGVKDLII